MVLTGTAIRIQCQLFTSGGKDEMQLMRQVATSHNQLSIKLVPAQTPLGVTCLFIYSKIARGGKTDSMSKVADLKDLLFSALALSLSFSLCAHFQKTLSAFLSISR